MPKHIRRIGDTLIPLSVQLLRKSGRQELPVDLTGKTVKFKMLNEDGEEVVPLTDEGVEVVDAEQGKVSFSFGDYESGSDGKFYAYFVVIDDQDRTDTFPTQPKNLVVEINVDVPEGED